MKPKFDIKSFRLRDFVEWELEYFRKECNFTDEEMEYFNLRAKNKSNIQISIAMSVSESTVAKLARGVKKKVIKVL